MSSFAKIDGGMNSQSVLRQSDAEPTRKLNKPWCAFTSCPLCLCGE